MVRTILGVGAGVVMALAAVFLFAWFLWWLWTRRDTAREAPAIELKAELPPSDTPAEAELEGEQEPAEEEEAEEPSAPDDLKRIEGIGPKLASVLEKAGISTFAQLADAEVARLEQILEQADPRLLRLANANTWPEQAALAAAGDWEALEALQKELKRGRKS